MNSHRPNPDRKRQRRMAMLQADRRIAQATSIVQAREPGTWDDAPVADRVCNVLGILYGALVEFTFSGQRCADMAAEAYAELRRVRELIDDETSPGSRLKRGRRDG